MPDRSAPTWARRITRASLLLLALLALLVVAVRAIAGTVPLLEARAVMFSRYADRARFEAPPERLLAGGFRTDAGDDRRRWRDTLRVHPRLGASLDSVADIPGAVPRAEALARLFSNWGTSAAGCGTLERLADKIRDTGCCSDHTEVFLALAPAAGLFAREVMFGVHGVVEVWDPERRRWAMIDPMLGERFEAPDGRTLSLLEVREAMLAGAPPARRAFRPGPLSPTAAREVATYYEPWRFETAAMTFGANVIAEDALRRRLAPLPLPATRVVGYALGVTPWYVALEDARTSADVARRRLARDAAWAALALLGVGLLAWPAAALAARLRR